MLAMSEGRVLAQCFVCSDTRQNTAVGFAALGNGPTGSDNTAVGSNALYSNTSGVGNTAAGFDALSQNTTGNYNNASGLGALASNNGDDNNAMGYAALYANTSGTLNNAVGSYALRLNTTGNGNNAVGYAALYANGTGSNNSAQGLYALSSNTNGSNNVALGNYAGYNNTTGSWNIDIGNRGNAADVGVTRIGDTNQHATFVSGIFGTTISGGATVVVSASGQLGVMSSSSRYKENIQPMGDSSERIYGLQPVTFTYKQADSNGGRPLQFGLVAEQVAKVMPELVVYNAQGEPETVAYQELASLLVNELQRERRSLRRDHELMVEQRQAVAAQAAQIAALRRELGAMQKLLSQIASERAEGTANRVAMASESAR
jgi:hypothetical protein